MLILLSPKSLNLLKHVYSALLRLLHDAVGSDNSNSKYVELVMKCLWRIVRNLNEWIHTINISSILVDIHLFLQVRLKTSLFLIFLLTKCLFVIMKAYPSANWKDRQSDTPIRTIKTIIHTLVRLQGETILTHLGYIENLKDSELEPYLKKILKNGVAKDKDPLGKQSGGDFDTNVPEKKDVPSKARRLSKSSQETLTAIFRKIGSKEQSQEVN